MKVEVRSRDELIAEFRKGVRPHYLFFWGHKPLPGGEVGKPCLSQWWPTKFLVDGLSYASAEHFMMAGKARLFGDEDARARIINASSPKLAKQLGRRVKNFNEGLWRDARFQLVVEGNYAKFKQNPELAAFLISTGNKLLVEASPTDSIWGIGLAADDDRAKNPERWRGLNLLGFALMEVRQNLIEAL